jgi:hypothetical protein
MKLQHAIHRAQAISGGATIYVPADNDEFAGATDVEINSSASGRGSLRITHNAELTSLRRDKNNLFIGTDYGWRVGL